MLLSKHQPFLLFFYFQGIYLCLSCAPEYEGKAEEGLVKSRDVDLVDFSLSVAVQLEGERFPGAGSILVVGSRGLRIATEAYLALYLATVKFGIKQDLAALSARHEYEWRTKPNVLVKIKIQTILIAKAFIGGIVIIEIITVICEVEESVVYLFVKSQSGGTDIINVTDDKRIIKGVDDIVVENYACCGADRAGLTVLRSADAHPLDAACKSAYGAAGVGIVNAKSVIVIIKKRYPVFGIEHKLAGPMSVAGVLADYLGKLSAGLGILADVGYDSVKFAVGVDRRKLLTAGMVLGLVGAMVIEPCGDVYGLAVETVPKLEIALAGHVIKRPLHRNALDVHSVTLDAMLKHLGAVEEAVSRLNGIPTGVSPVYTHLGALGMEGHGARIEGELYLTSPVPAVYKVFVSLFGKIGDSAAESDVCAKLDVFVFNINYVFVKYFVIFLFCEVMRLI